MGLMPLIREKSRLRLLYELRALAGDIKTNIRYLRLPLFEIIERSAQKENCGRFTAACDRYCRTEDDFYSAWQKACGEFLDKRDLQLAEALGEKLGKSDADGQEECLDFFLAEIEEKIKQAKQNADYCKRVKLSLYCCGSLAAVLIFI